MSQEKGSLSSKLSRFLLSYNSTPQTVTGVSPAELSMNRKIKTVLDWIIPEKTTVRERMREHQEIQNFLAIREFTEGELVFAKIFYTGSRWKKGVVERQRGPMSYEIELESGTCGKATCGPCKKKTNRARLRERCGNGRNKLIEKK